MKVVEKNYTNHQMVDNFDHNGSRTYLHITAIMTQFDLPAEAFLVDSATFWISSMILLTSGTIFAMWLGERITDKGVGNGISLLITVGIIANFPSAFLQEFVAKTTNTEAGVYDDID